MSLLTFTDANFEADVLTPVMPVLVMFSAAWCGTCAAMTPTIEQLAEDFAGRMSVGKIDVDAYPEIADRYGVRGLPTMLLFQGGEVVGRAIGFVPKKVLADTLEKAVGNRQVTDATASL